MAALEAGLLVREDHLEEQHRKLESVRLVAVKNEAALELPAVLQTYVIPLQGVRQELAAWVPPMTDEYQSLIKETRALSRRTMEELETDLLFEAMEVAPGILVPIMKAPYMERNELVLWSAVIGLKLSSEALQARRSPRTCSLAGAERNHNPMPPSEGGRHELGDCNLRCQDGIPSRAQRGF